MASSTTWLEVGDGVFTRRYPFLDQQIGAILGRGEVLVVDTRATPHDARELLDDLRRLTRDPVTIAVNTHWHWDHAFGNSAVRPAVIWGHERCRAELIANGSARLAGLDGEYPDRAQQFREVVIDPPDRTLTIAADIVIGGRRVELRYLGRGHTAADIVVVVPDADVLFAGDLLENGAAPWFGDGYPLDWPATTERMLALARGSVVPGHGAVADRAFVEASLSGFRAVAAAAVRLHSGAIDRDAALASIPYSREDAAAALDRALAQARGELD